MDGLFERFRGEVPHLKLRPSEYLRRNFWFTTQPMEEPEKPEHLRQMLDWMGWDRILFASDYPHWDSDDPRYAFKIRMSETERRGIFVSNAEAVWGQVTSSGCCHCFRPCKSRPYSFPRRCLPAGSRR